jgi:2'-5' RNA ligase
MYFIAVVLPEKLNRNVLQYKQYMLEKYGCRVGLKSPAHITIVPPFWLEENKEEQLLTDVDLVAKDVSAFAVTTQNFSAFRPKTIFIGVQANEQLRQLKKTADDFFYNKDFYQLKIESRAFHPHITIATRDLCKKDFFDAWPFFEKENFEEDWQAQGLSVLKHNKRNWDVIHTSLFQS